MFIDRDRQSGIYANGEIITYTVSISNLSGPGANQIACDVDGVNITFTYPDANGEDKGTTVTIATNLSMAAGSQERILAQLPYKLAVNPGVVNTRARATITGGALHNLANRDDPLGDFKTISTGVAPPSITIDKKGSIEQGAPPAQVTYTYDVTNTSAAPIPLSQVGVKDDLCTNPTYTSGDDGNMLLTQGEVWRFTCVSLHQAAGVYINTARACAINTLDGKEVCSEPDTWKVTLTPPPPPAVPGAVKPQSVAQPEKCTLATPSGLRVRAREQTTIKVTVRNVDAGSVARITLPGGKTVSAKTNSKGVATFKVRPPKTGTARITVAECSDVERLTVRPARQVVAQRVPRVTG
jgi:hypothetical protein